MHCNDIKYQAYLSILKEELVPAMGCTEPIAIAYCASVMRDALGNIPSEVIINVSGNILKNVKSVTVPNTGGMHGIDVAAAIGIIAGDSNKKLEVIANVKEEEFIKLKEYLDNTSIKINHSDNDSVLYIEIIGKYLDDEARVIIKDAHTNITLIEKNNETIYENNKKVDIYESKTDKSILSISEIVEFIKIVIDLCEVYAFYIFCICTNWEFN